MNQQQKANLKFINIYSKFWYIQCANQKLLILTWVSIILPFRGHSFMIFAKWKLLNASPFISTAIQFWSVLPSVLLQWMSITEFRRTPLPKKWYFEIFLISFNSEINKLLSLLKCAIFTSFISIIKLTGKQTHVNRAYSNGRPLYFFCF